MRKSWRHVTLASLLTNQLIQLEKAQPLVHARKISVMDIRKTLLDKHEKMGLFRDKSDDLIDSLSEDEVKVQLKMVHEGVDETDPRACLKKISRQRFLKVWHHTSIAGHGHLLVLVSCVYDPAFYYTTKSLVQPWMFNT